MANKGWYPRISIRKGEKGIELVFLDQENKELPSTERNPDVAGGATWVDFGCISLLAIERNPIEVWIKIGNTRYCFLFEDGQIIGMCG